MSLSAGYSDPSLCLVLAFMVVLVAWGGVEVNFSPTPSSDIFLVGTGAFLK